ncbi:helix-turn-helix domain-containing protein [Chitinolyticbacter meiyuanensis]|uniref:helix-turn-helix domain-containing protein n=1 Tax=Chitinolyticbacter meiyuanensis TaxID=682798 RepID=UPI0011E5EBD3|nr:AraC family transcriptional regulator [Chitinolyticbacter meiyuanensis]
MLTRELVGQTFGQAWHYLYLEAEQVPFLWHHHPEFELTFTRHARGMRYVGDDVAPFGELDLVLVGPSQPHTWQAVRRDDGGLQQVQVVYFREEWLRTLGEGGLPELVSLATWLANARGGIVFSAACAAVAQPLFDRLHAARGVARLSLLLQLFELLMNDDVARRIDGRSGNISEDGRVKAALEYLQQHYREATTLADVAAAAHTSPATLKRLLHGALDTSVTDIVQQLRLGHACNLLITSELPVEIVAAQSGYASPSLFYRQFARQRGVSPAAFRRRHHLRHGEGAPPSLEFNPCGGNA